ncbi:MAG: hypothetical protein WCR46_08505 [Deltaproteobacteria bacterium]
MRVIFDHPFRFAISFFLIIFWLMFLYMTSHTTDYYLYRIAKEVTPGEIISWRNEASKLILKGWSHAEIDFRWSQNRQVEICFKPDKTLFRQLDFNRELTVTFEIAPIPELERKEVQFSLSPNGATGSAIIACGRSIYAISSQFETIPDIVCLKIILPFTSQGSLGEDRQLGIMLYSVAFK